MKTFASSLVAFLFTATLASADWVLVQKTHADGQDKEMLTKIKGEQARVDMGEQMSVIVGAEGMLMLMHAQKVLMKMDLATMKTAMEMTAKASVPLDKQPVAKPVATGQKEKVGEWEAEIFTWEGPVGKGRFWVAKDFPKFAEINAVSDKLGKAVGNSMAGLSPQAADFNGMVVKSEMTMMGKSMTTLLVAAKEQEVEAKEFATPEGYSEMKMPAMPGAPPK
ncbi:MAG: DUF4412 domain-containing protein [Prosthecobacter sp.]|uniref:DUF4412 domain-containing protein n=1 Tax=Prosthecobacter sp. TaxID=1965333 RepID=UPI0038FF24F3